MDINENALSKEIQFGEIDFSEDIAYVSSDSILLDSLSSTQSLSETSSDTFIIPASQYGWDIDIVVDSEWTNFVLGSDHCLVFHSDISARYGSDGRVILTLGTDNMKYFRRASHTWVDKNGSGDSYHNIGYVLLSTVDITGRGDYPDFPANYSFSGTDNPIEDIPVEVITECKYEPKPLLWESDIVDYDTTDGLLLLILCVLVVSIFLKR